MPLPAGWTPIRTVTADGVELAGVRCPGPGSGPPAKPPADPTDARPPRTPGPAFVIGHGFTHDTAAPATRRVIAGFGRYGPVVALDFRGHGRSAGRSSVGRDETLDLDAAVRLARPLTTGPVAVVGFSMGGAVALRQAAIGADPPDAVVAVSAPSRWYLRRTGPMRRVHALLEHPLGPLVGRAIGVRLGPPWPRVPPTPLELAHRIPPRPLLLVHGDADPYFGPEEAVALHRAAGGTGPLWLERGMGHAETASTADLIDRMARWVADTLANAEPDTTRVAHTSPG